MGEAAYYGKIEVLERLYAVGGNINIPDKVSVISIGIAAVFSQVVYYVLCCSPHTGGGGEQQWAQN